MCGCICVCVCPGESVCVCVWALCHLCVPVYLWPSPAQHLCCGMRGWVTEAQIEPAFLLQLLLLFLLNLDSRNPFYCQPEETVAPQRAGHPLWLCGAVISCGSADPECALERAAEDGETGRLRKRLISPEEGEEGEEEDEEPALHSCDSCRQVFESLSDLTEHKINQCQLTGKQRSAHRASPPLCHSALLRLPLSLYAFARERAMLCVLVHRAKGSATPDYHFPW